MEETTIHRATASSCHGTLQSTSDHKAMVSCVQPITERRRHSSILSSAGHSAAVSKVPLPEISSGHSLENSFSGHAPSLSMPHQKNVSKNGPPTSPLAENSKRHTVEYSTQHTEATSQGGIGRSFQRRILKITRLSVVKHRT